MNKKIFFNKLFVVLLCGLIITAQSADALARPRMNAPRRSHEYNRRPGHVETRHRYDDNDAAIVCGALVLGLVGVLAASSLAADSACSTGPVVSTVRTVRVLPRGHRAMVVRGTTYYYCDNVYYTACPSGYMLVSPPPAVPAALVLSPEVTQLQNVPGQAVTIHVPNSNGSYTPVRLIKQNDGYIGPQGEYYAGNPTVEQLTALYGK